MSGLAEAVQAVLALFEPEARRVRRGVVKWYDPAKAYGFIVPDEPLSPDRNDVFVHASVLDGMPLELGQRVEFEVTSGRGRHANRPRAVAVKVIA